MKSIVAHVSIPTLADTSEDRVKSGTWKKYTELSKSEVSQPSFERVYEPSPTGGLEKKDEKSRRYRHVCGVHGVFFSIGLQQPLRHGSLAPCWNHEFFFVRPSAVRALRNLHGTPTLMILSRLLRHRLLVRPDPITLLAGQFATLKQGL